MGIKLKTILKSFACSSYFILAQLSAFMPKPQLLHSFAGVVESPIHLPHTVHSSFLLPNPCSAHSLA